MSHLRETARGLTLRVGGNGSVRKETMPGRGAQEQDRMAKAHTVFVRLVLPPYTIHFKSPTYMRDATLEMLDKRVCKETVKGTAQSVDVREAIGTDPQFWTESVVLFRAAVPSLERRSFTGWDPSSVDYESTSGALIASNYPGLWKDLERLNDLVSISRNVLTVGDRVQDLAAECSVDTEVFRIINCCVRVTARGYDGEAGTGDEEKWQWIVNAYKKLLITSLQFLNNLVAQNERRKLLLWVALFDNTSEGVLAAEDIPETSRASLADVPSNPTARPTPPLTPFDFLIGCGFDGRTTLSLEGAEFIHPNYPWKEYPKEVLDARERLEGNGLIFYARQMRETATEDLADEDWLGRDPTLAELHIEIVARWIEMEDSSRSHWQGLYEDSAAKYKQDCAVFDAKLLAALPMKPRSALQTPEELAKFEKDVNERLKTDVIEHVKVDLTSTQPSVVVDGALSHPPVMFTNQDLQSRPVVADDMKMLFTADAGHRILLSGKAELMKRLEGYEPPDPNLPPSRHPDGVTTRPVKLGPGQFPVERTRSMSRSPPIYHPRDPRKLERERLTAQVQAGIPIESIPETYPEAVTENNMAFTRRVHDDQSVDEEGEEDDVEEEESVEAEDDEEEDYPGSTEDGRGLLTDVPLILGPSEIEVLPMLIMSGIVPPTNNTQHLTTEEKNALTNMHTVRTHLLLSQSNGRNLLRELLIFVAAWDLREEELYFKFMVKIMEAILKNGLMPYAYHAFRDRSRSKDIISPAQAVIMKLLTCIFRARGEATKAGGPQQPKQLAHPTFTLNGQATNMPSRVDLHILNFIFTEFRQHIIPQTCALIFLQGQIHQGRASPEDFPLNLWDMERMYEGVYQYLEFFAVLTEEGVWKGILGEWEMASELVTLLRELEGGIPKMNGLSPASAVMPPTSRKISAQPVHGTTPMQHVPQRSLSADAAMASSQGPIAVERPFDLAADTSLPPLPLHPPTNPIFEAETPLAYPEDPIVAPLNTHDLQHAADQDEPSDFEWRNLKKLTVLVLSSLIWKNKGVQDQVKDYGGLKALVDCCRTDDHNPYIREHAIMCLRFAVEGNEENSEAIRQMAGTNQKQLLEGGAVTIGGAMAEDVPREVLDTNGYETFMDGKGQVGLRRKDGSLASGHSLTFSTSNAGPSTLASNTVTGPPAAGGVVKPRLSATKMTAEKAAELMQNALRDLPLGDKLVTDKQKAEALAKLDKAFESTEKALGRQKGVWGGK